MAVTSEVRSFLDMVAAAETAPVDQLSPAEMRAGYAALASLATRPEVASVTDLTMPGPGGDLPLRLYRPAGAPPGTPLPCLVWFHGGGWVIGDLETADPTARHLANGAGVAVLSVGYRLAPEHPFPAAFDDALAAVRWVANHAAELGVDPDRLAVGGDSAGGNLAAEACLHLRDSGPPLSFQLLVYPVVDAHLGFPSIDENGEGYFLTKATMLWFRRHYLGDGDRDDPRVSPLWVPDGMLVGLPPALVVTAEHDPLRDEGEAYGQRLRAAGVDVTVTRYAGMIHGFFALPDLVPEARGALAQAAGAVGAALGARRRPRDRAS